MIRPVACANLRECGVVQPLAMVTMFQVFPASQRGFAMGIYGFGVVLSPAIGPTIGGLQ